MYTVDGIPFIDISWVIWFYTGCILGGAHCPGLSQAAHFPTLYIFFMNWNLIPALARSPACELGCSVTFMKDATQPPYDSVLHLFPISMWSHYQFRSQPACVLIFVNRIDSERHSFMLGRHLLLWWTVLFEKLSVMSKITCVHKVQICLTLSSRLPMR